MSDRKTYGQIAYEAWTEILECTDGEVRPAWDDLDADAVNAWMAAGSAVDAQVRTDGIDAAAVGQPGAQPAPELAAAMAETRTVRAELARLCQEFGPSAQSGWSARISLTVLNRYRRTAGVGPLSRTPSNDREDTLLRYRRERDEARAENERIARELTSARAQLAAAHAALEEVRELHPMSRNAPEIAREALEADEGREPVKPGSDAAALHALVARLLDEFAGNIGEIRVYAGECGIDIDAEFAHVLAGLDGA